MATRQINLEVSLKNERTFNDAMKKVTNNLDGLKSEMALCSAEFKGNEKSQEALTQKSKILSQQVEQQKVRVEALTKMYEKQRDRLGEDSAAADKYRKELNNAKAELVKMEQAQEETNEELKKASSLYGKAKEWLDKMSPAAKKAGSALLTVGKAALTAGGRLAKWTAAAGAAAAAAAGTMMVAGVKTLAEWGTAAIESAKAAEEAGEKLTLPQQRWLAYSKQLDGIKASAEQAKTGLSAILLPALELLSDEGWELLKNFSTELSQAAGDPQAIGRVLSKYIKQFSKFIAEKLPEIMELADEFLDALGEGFAENKDEIKESVETIIKSLVGFAAEHADDIGEIAVFIISTLAEAVIDNAPELLGAGLKILLKLIEGIASGLPDFLTETLPNLVKSMMAEFKALAPKFKESGSAIGQALFGGVVEKVRQAKEWLANAISNIAASISNFFRYGTGGVEARMNYIPDPYYDGYATGLNYVPYDNFPALLHKGEMVLTAAQSAQYRAGNGGAPATASAGAAAAGNGGTYIENINVQSVPQTPAETAAAIRAALEQARWL